MFLKKYHNHSNTWSALHEALYNFAPHDVYEASQRILYIKKFMWNASN